MTSQADRFSDFVDYLMDHPTGGTARQIADALGVNRKTVQRWVNKAPQRGVSLEEDQYVYRLPSRDRVGRERTVALNQAQIRLLTQVLADKTRHSPELRQVIEKLKEAQDERLRQQFSAAPFLHLTQQDDLPDGLLDQLAHAITVRKTLQVTYRNAQGQHNQYLFDPYGIIQRRDHLYLVGHNHAARPDRPAGVSVLRLDGLQQVALTIERFAKPAFELSHYAQQNFGVFAAEGPPVAVRLWVTPAKAYAIARTPRHASQECEWQPDGSLHYSLNVPLTPELVWWIVGYAGAVRVMAPPELREKVLAHARAVLEAEGEIF